MKDEQDKGIKKTCRSRSAGSKISLEGFNCHKVWILVLIQITCVLHRTYKYSVIVNL